MCFGISKGFFRISEERHTEYLCFFIYRLERYKTNLAFLLAGPWNQGCWSNQEELHQFLSHGGESVRTRQASKCS